MKKNKKQQQNSTNEYDNIYECYVRTRQDNDTVRLQEQAKMDDIIKTCGIGSLGVEFGFLGIIYKEEIACGKLFVFAAFLACLSIVMIFLSSWCSVRDIKESNDELDRRYRMGENIFEEIKTKYTEDIEWLNLCAIIFLVAGIVFFAIFVYTNYR